MFTTHRLVEWLPQRNLLSAEATSKLLNFQSSQPQISKTGAQVSNHPEVSCLHLLYQGDATSG